MAIVELVTRHDLPAYSYFTSLDGTLFKLTFNWNSRMNNGVGKWMLALLDSRDRPLIGAVPIIANWPLITRFKFNGLPKGVLFTFDTSGKALDPGRFDLGDRVRLFYREAR